MRGIVELTIIGSASAEPNPGNASSCYLLDAGQGQLILECGHGAAAKLLLYTSFERLGAVLISHMHPDHFFDLVPLKYLITFNGHPRLRLYLPPTGPAVLDGIKRGLGERDTFWESAYDIRVFDPNHGLEILGMRIDMCPSHHFIPAWAMRIADRHGKGVLGYTSDTSPAGAIRSLLKNVDLLLAESSIEHQTKPEAERGHLTGAEAGSLARAACAKQLVLTHYPQRSATAIQRAAMDEFGQPCALAVEGARYAI